MAVLAISLSFGIVGCAGAADIPTCSEYAQMAPDTGLLKPLNGDQQAALKDALRETGYDDSAYNVAIGSSEVLAYCNIYDGVANQNQDQPITNAL